MSGSSSTLVNVAEHAELRLVRLLSDVSGEDESNVFVSTCEIHIANADAPGLIRAILHNAQAMNILMGECENETAESGPLPLEEASSAFSLLAALLKRVESAAMEVAMAEELANTVVSYPTPSWSKKLSMLCALYNLRPNGVEKCRLLGRVIVLAAAEQPSLLAPAQPYKNVLSEAAIDSSEGDNTSASSSTGVLSETLHPSNLEELVKSWGSQVPVEEKRNLYLIAANSMKDIASASVSQSFLLKVLATYTDPSQVDSQAILVAKDAATGAIRDPITLFTEQRGMLSLPAIQALSNQPDTKALFDLLKIFQEDMLADFQAFCDKYGSNAVVELVGAVADDIVEQCRTNMRMLSLCSLASEQYYQQGEIPYQAIADTLSISPDQVEPWVISAVGSGLITAKMDQLNNLVMVERSVMRKFGPEQWRMLQTRLHAWKSNVAQVLETLKQQDNLSAVTAAAPTEPQQ